MRRTLATVLADSGVSGDVARRVTGHIATDVHGRVYDRAARLDDMRAALLIMENWVLAAAAKTVNNANNVVPIRQQR